MHCASRTVVSLALAVVSAACNTTQIDTSDRQAFYFEARVEKELEGATESRSPHLEAAWTRADGDVDELEYTINTVNAGFGFSGTKANGVWGGAAAGLSLQYTALEAEAADLDDGDFGIGPYVAIEGGWHVTPVIEPWARTELAFYLPDLSSIFAFEIGARFHVIEHAALFAGWRYTIYNVRDITSGTSVEEIELDASGLVVGFNFAF